MFGIVAVLVGSLFFPSTAPVVAYDHGGVLTTRSAVRNGEHMSYQGKSYQAVSVRQGGSVTTFYTVPRLVKTGEVTFSPS
jgi:hypothetical protein